RCRRRTLARGTCDCWTRRFGATFTLLPGTQRIFRRGCFSAFGTVAGGTTAASLLTTTTRPQRVGPRKDRRGNVPAPRSSLFLSDGTWPRPCPLFYGSNPCYLPQSPSGPD